MVTTKQMKIKSKTYYYHNDLINIKDFDPKLLKLDKRHQWILRFIILDMSQKKISIKLIV